MCPPVHVGPSRDDPGCLALSHIFGSSLLCAPCMCPGELEKQALMGETPAAKSFHCIATPWLSRGTSAKSWIRAYHDLEKSIP